MFGIRLLKGVGGNVGVSYFEWVNICGGCFLGIECVFSSMDGF